MPVAMTRCRWRGTGRAGLFVLVTTLIPLTVTAADPAAITKTPTTATTSLHQAVAREAARAAVTTPMTADSTKRSADQSNGGSGAMHFLKSRPGMIAVTVMAIGTGYAVYSANHDRIVSAGRK